jgi:hypothetical protein
MIRVGTMRIYIQPPHVNGSIDGSVRTAHEILHRLAITSARPGGIINDRGVILIEACDVTKALAVLKQAGLRAVLD